MTFQKSDLNIDEFWIITGQANIFVNSKLVHGILEQQARSANERTINKN